jgi:hypothetical protein
MSGALTEVPSERPLDHLIEVLQLFLHTQEAKLPDDCTHVFSFWVGMPSSTKRSCGLLFNESATARYLTIVQSGLTSEKDVLNELRYQYGFVGLELVKSYAVAQVGSSASYRAMILRKSQDAKRQMGTVKVQQHLALVRQELDEDRRRESARLAAHKPRKTANSMRAGIML